MDGELLSTIWIHYTQTENSSVALKIAEMITDMGEMRFSGIGGFTSRTTYALGPTVEVSKLCKGRVSFRMSLHHFIDLHVDRANFILTDVNLSTHTKQKGIYSYLLRQRDILLYPCPHVRDRPGPFPTHVHRRLCAAYEMRGCNLRPAFSLKTSHSCSCMVTFTIQISSCEVRRCRVSWIGSFPVHIL